MNSKSTLSLFALASIALLTGCGGPTPDTSSEAAFKKSTDEMAKSLDPAKKAQFEEAIGTLMFSKVLFNSADEATMKKNMKDTFEGKSVDQIIAAAATAKAETNAEMKKLAQ